MITAVTGLARANSPPDDRVIRASVALLLLLVGASPPPAWGRPTTADLPASTKPGRLIDRSHRLSRRDAAALENRLAATSLRLGSPITVVVVDGLHHDTAASAAARAFADLPVSPDTRANPILLLVSPRDRAAAIETGKGIAGIVPQIEAQQITTRLAAASGDGDLSASLVRAFDAIIVSAEATAERRRPAAIDEDLPPTETAASPVDGDADSAAGSADEVASGDEVPSQGDAAPTPPAGPARRSRLPAAIGIAALVLLALALRRRKNLAKVPAPPPPPSPRPPAARR